MDPALHGIEASVLDSAFPLVDDVTRMESDDVALSARASRLVPCKSEPARCRESCFEVKAQQPAFHHRIILTRASGSL
jgi:hypothetical protein